MASCRCRHDRCRRRPPYQCRPIKQCISIDGSNGATKVNCGCTPCEKPVVVDEGDVCKKKLVPILADVLENCISINRYETAYPSTITDGATTQNLAIQTNLPIADVNAGDLVCIKCINYSYDCVGPNAGTIDGVINGKTTTFIATNLSCSCDAGAGFASEEQEIYNDFSTQITTKGCVCYDPCCPGSCTQEEYVQNKIVETGVSFGICNLTISVSGTIGNQCFSGVLGSYQDGVTDFAVIGPALPLELLTFPSTFNFAGTMCLPSNKKIKLEETFDNCLVVDCIRPTSSSYTASTPVTALTVATFDVSTELSLIIRKMINAVTTQKIAVLSNCGAKVICSDGQEAMPTCPGDENNCGGYIDCGCNSCSSTCNCGCNSCSGTCNCGCTPCGINNCGCGCCTDGTINNCCSGCCGPTNCPGPLNNQA